MSVIMESLEGDPIYILADFVACPEGEPFSWDRATEFKIGDSVSYVEEFKDDTSRQEYLAFMVRFKKQDGIVFAAVQQYFVTEGEWENLHQYFRKKKLGT